MNPSPVSHTAAVAFRPRLTEEDRGELDMLYIICPSIDSHLMRLKGNTTHCVLDGKRMPLKDAIGVSYAEILSAVSENRPVEAVYLGKKFKGSVTLMGKTLCIGGL